MLDLMVAIDGGGSTCRAAIADPCGRILGRATTGPANIVSAPHEARANIVAATQAALAEAGMADCSLSRFPALLGLAGVNTSTPDTLAEPPLPFARTVFVDDVEIAFEGAIGEGDGLIAIFGTGSVFMSRRGGQVTKAGGWGFVSGDQASGARLGQALIEQTLLAHDGLRPPSDLSRALLDEYGNDPGRLVAFATAAAPVDFARLAPRLFKAADEGDGLALAILTEACGFIDRALDHFGWADCPRLCLMGGLAPLYRLRLAARHRDRLSEPRADALTGAVARARRHFHPAAETPHR
ncbi:BadF/BadG/BcrA/BcrD ATPase family protein [Stappia indica]|uniref:BadF/BadG/BcrA/BcrD ATPase family protein n=1 Tax=Stappia indica TaxID=538381 RepID=UPI001CD5B9E7|nr:BadF/BadG/BcrA/BcrD ATPase family protein [Stappia indica]MCA1299587.1 N-acetylglucosamine kinase [Stappia indica]